MPLISEIAQEIYQINQNLFVIYGHLPEVQWVINMCILLRDEKISYYELQVALARVRYFFQVDLIDVLSSQSREDIIDGLSESINKLLLLYF